MGTPSIIHGLPMSMDITIFASLANCSSGKATQLWPSIDSQTLFTYIFGGTGELLWQVQPENDCIHRRDFVCICICIFLTDVFVVVAGGGV